MCPAVDAAPMLVEEPLHIDVADPTVGVGNGFTVILTESDAEQPVAVIVSVTVYIVVTVGLTEGLLLVEV